MTNRFSASSPPLAMKKGRWFAHALSPCTGGLHNLGAAQTLALRVKVSSKNNKLLKNPHARGQGIVLHEY